MLGIKFTDRTIRFVNLATSKNGLQITSAGAGLCPFTAMYRGRIRPAGVELLREALDRSLDRAGVERDEAVVVLDGRSVVHLSFPVPAHLISDREALDNRVAWELNRRCAAGDPERDLHIDHEIRGTRDGYSIVDVWGCYSGTLELFERIIEGTGCRVGAWDCDPRAISRLYRAYSTNEELEELSAIAYMEAESLDIALIGGSGHVSATSLLSDMEGPLMRHWDSANPEEVAREVKWWIEKLKGRWLQSLPGTPADLNRLLFTGSVEEPDSLLAALVRTFPVRVEMIDMHAILEVDEELAMNPLIQGNFGSFALCIGGALAMVDS